MQSIKLIQLKSEICYDDGSLRDINIRNMSKDDWTAFLSKIVLNYKFKKSNGQNAPGNFIELVDELSVEPFHVVLSLKGRVNLICNFFITKEDYSRFEITLDPREVKTDDDLHEILSFMRNLGNVLKKEVCLTPENCSDDKILSYTSENELFHFFNESKNKYLVDLA